MIHNPYNIPKGYRQIRVGEKMGKNVYYYADREWHKYKNYITNYSGEVVFIYNRKPSDNVCVWIKKKSENVLDL